MVAVYFTICALTYLPMKNRLYRPNYYSVIVIAIIST